MSTPAPGQDPPGDDPEERDPGLARERTSLAWTRTAISFAALGGTMLKANVITGLIILAVAPLIWHLGRISRGRPPAPPLPIGPSHPTDPPRPTDPSCPTDPSRPAGPARSANVALPAVGAARLFLIAAAIVAVSLLCLFVAIFGQSAPIVLR